MRLAIPARRTREESPPDAARGWALGLALGAVAVGAAANLTHDRLFHREAPAAGAGPTGPAAGPGGAGHDPATTVAMPEGKYRAAGIVVEPARAVALPREVGVAGRIEADPSRRIEVRPRAPGVIRSAPPRPGTRVRRGDVLVVLDSPEVGSARLLVRERQRALATTRVEADWRAEVAANIEAMIAQLRKGTPAPELARQFASKKLGAARGTLLSAYSDLEIAAHEADKQLDLNQKKVVGEHPVFLAQHARESAQAKFEAALEQVRFDVGQQDRVARQEARDAEERVVDAAQRLRVLGVDADVDDLLAHPGRASAPPSGAEDLTAYPILAPFDGTLIATSAVASQQAGTDDTLAVLADLSTVWAVAHVPESDFAGLPGLGGGAVALSAAAYPGRRFPARMLFAGSEVDPATRSIRLVAELEDPEGLLKLGMFARVTLDARATEEATTVPPGAVVEVEGKPAVFVPGPGERTFVIRPVRLGREAQGRRVVAEGLRPGDRVVVAGAFAIKSELILQNETDEE